MREISASLISQTVEELCIRACYHLGDDVVKLLKAARKGRLSLWPVSPGQIIENIKISGKVPSPVSGYRHGSCFIELGHDVHITGGSLTEAVNQGVRRVMKGFLRKSVLSP